MIIMRRDKVWHQGSLVFGEFYRFETVTPAKVNARLEFWKEFNDYAVKDRGEGSRSEFLVIEE